MAQNDICIPFTITDVKGTKHHFEAVRFLEDHEFLVTIEEACRRAGDRVVESEHDWFLIFDNRRQLPDALLEFSRLVTKRQACIVQGPYVDPDCVSCVGQLCWEGWDSEYALPPHRHCGNYTLVLRRSA